MINKQNEENKSSNHAHGGSSARNLMENKQNNEDSH